MEGRSPKPRSVTREPDRPVLALSWMAFSAMGFAAMAVFVKRLSPIIPQFELVFFRSLINFAVFFLVMVIRREDLFPTGKPLLVFRGVMGFFGICCLFYTIGHLPLSIAMMLSWCSPLFVILFSSLFLGERIGASRIIWIGVAFVGLWLLFNPAATSSARVPAFAFGVGLLGAAFAGSAYVAVRVATATVGVNAIILYFMAVASLLSAPLAAREFRVPEPSHWVEILMVGLTASIAQFFHDAGLSERTGRNCERHEPSECSIFRDFRLDAVRRAT